jgi:hypothetical protein
VNPQTVMEHVSAGRYVPWAELAEALAVALDQRDQARTERDSALAVLTLATVTVTA